MPCSACHRIGPEGGRIGPDLSGIGKIRRRRDLLEAIVFPSATFVQDYQSVNVTTTSGQTFSGVIERKLADAIDLRASDRSVVRIARDQIDNLSASTVSIMPEGLDRSLSTQELSDLLAYLLSQ